MEEYTIFPSPRVTQCAPGRRVHRGTLGGPSPTPHTDAQGFAVQANESSKSTTPGRSTRKVLSEPSKVYCGRVSSTSPCALGNGVAHPSSRLSALCHITHLDHAGTRTRTQIARTRPNDVTKSVRRCRNATQTSLRRPRGKQAVAPNEREEEQPLVLADAGTSITDSDQTDCGEGLAFFCISDWPDDGVVKANSSPTFAPKWCEPQPSLMRRNEVRDPSDGPTSAHQCVILRPAAQKVVVAKSQIYFSQRCSSLRVQAALPRRPAC